MLNVTQLQQRAGRYEFADGIREFHFAFWVLVTGFYGFMVFDMPALWQPFAEWVRAQNIVVMILTTFIIPIGIPLLISQVGLHWANEYLRRRWLWRSTGFIKPKRWLVPRRVLALSFAIEFVIFTSSILLAIQLQDATFIFRGVYVSAGLANAFMALNVASRFQIPRYRLIAAVGAVSTLILALLPLRLGLFVLVFSLFWGALLVITGLYAVYQTAQRQKVAADAS